ncbi:MAG: ATP-binding cassette domain-containing protein, partial [Pseudolabrys sp.]
MSLLLEARNVSKSYGVFQALENVNMTVSENELVSVVGPNGAGKTTLVNLFT